jgi:tRNA threonylcarbamoyladenosine biosynthesis protein TsaE
MSLFGMVSNPYRIGDCKKSEFTPFAHLSKQHAVNVHLTLDNLQATEAFGRKLGTLLFPNAVIALIGPLGAGKTHLTRAIAEGLEIENVASVSSPTFVLIQEYNARLPIFHFDAYRLSNVDAFIDLGVHEYYEGDGVCLIEWADRVLEALPEERLTLTITPLDEQRRSVLVEANGARYVELAQRLCQ